MSKPVDEMAVRTWTHFPDVSADSDFEGFRLTLFSHVSHCEDCGMNPPRMCSRGVACLRDVIAAWEDR